MGKLADAVRYRYGGAAELRNAPPPDYRLGGTMASEYFNDRRDAEFGVEETRQRIQNHLAGMTSDELDMLYFEAVGDDISDGMDLLTFQNNAGNPRSNGSWLEESPFGSDGVVKMAEALERYYQNKREPEPEKIDALADDIGTFPPMTSPDYPPEEKYEYPVSAEIEAIRNSLPPEQQTEENFRLLEQVNEESKLLSQKYFVHLQKVGKDKLPINDGVENAEIGGMENFADHVMFAYADEYLQGKGKQYAGLLEPLKREHTYYRSAYITENADSKSVPGFMAVAPELEKLETDATEETLQDIQSVADDIDSLGPDAYVYEAYFNKRFKMPHSEMGDKDYALHPIRSARRELEDAVRTGDLEKIREAHGKYQSVKKVMDHMAETARTKPEKGQSELFEGNLDCLRGDQRSDIPEEYSRDFAGHSKLASTLLLNNYSKYTGIPIKEIIKNPVGTSVRATEQFLKDYGIASGKTTGAKLAIALSSQHASNMQREYGMGLGGCIHRCIEGVAGFAHSREEAVSIVGQASLARGAAFGKLRDEVDAWRELADGPAEKKQRLYELTILMPEDQLDMRDMPRRFGKETWKTDLGTDGLLKDAMAKGGFDYEGLIGKADRIAAEAYAEAVRLDDTFDSYSEFVPAEFRKASVTAFRKALAAAPEQDRNTPGYRKLLEEADRRTVGLESVTEAEQELDREMAILAREKTGWFIRKENSAEYDTMMAGLTTAKNKMRMLRGDTEGISAEEQERLGKIPLDKAIRDARRNTMDYSRKVEENGSKITFRYQAGADRANAATHSIEALDRIADAVKMRSTATQVEDQLQRDTMDERKDAGRVKLNAARSLYVSFIKSAPENFSPEMQENVLSTKTLNQGAKMIMEDPAFRRMVSSMSTNQLADRVISGSDAVLIAYVDAKTALRDNAVGKPGAEMTREERQEFIRNASFAEKKNPEGIEA